MYFCGKPPSSTNAITVIYGQFTLFVELQPNFSLQGEWFLLARIKASTCREKYFYLQGETFIFGLLPDSSYKLVEYCKQVGLHALADTILAMSKEYNNYPPQLNQE